MRKWNKHIDPTNKYKGTLTLGERTIELPPGTVISITRNQALSPPRLMLNSILTQIIMRSMRKNPELLYAELTGQLSGGIGQTVTVWKNTKRMHQFARNFFSWVFYSGKVQPYFLTCEHECTLPSPEELTDFVKTYGRHYDGAKLIKKSTLPK